MDRIFNIYKDKGMTSHDVVYKVRKILRTKKVGHTGTLDPDAVGVLPICVGRATKISDLILNKNKTYICEMKLGEETDTYDSSGKVLFIKDIDGISEDDVRKALEKQVGEINQYPPVYSALKVNGKKMCDLAREGKAHTIEIKPRKIVINKIKVLSIDLPNVKFEADCGKGTYVRSICHDVGELLGVGAHMTSLIRTRSGIFSIDRAITLEDLEKYRDEDKLIENSFSIEEALNEFHLVKLKDNAVKYYSNGGEIESRRFIEYSYGDSELSKLENGLGEFRVRVYSDTCDFIGVGRIYNRDGNIYVKSEKIFNIG